MGLGLGLDNIQGTVNVVLDSTSLMKLGIMLLFLIIAFFMLKHFLG
jgi:hypothetical protein